MVLHTYGNLFFKSFKMIGDLSENVFLQKEE